MQSEVRIHTDGACRGNPGPGGWGAVLEQGQTRKTLHGGERLTTNNRMELTAVIRALEALKRPCKVLVYSDSRYVLQGITEWLPNWKLKGWKTAARKPVLNSDLWQILDALVVQHDIKWHWVKGHSGNAGNEEADLLANRGIDELGERA
jgi:ribonuclease HI